MNKLDILYGLEVILFKHKKTKKDFIILEKLRNKNLIDWFSWYDEKIGHFKYDINTTHKGLLYYTKNKKKEIQDRSYNRFSYSIVSFYLFNNPKHLT